MIGELAARFPVQSLLSLCSSLGGVVQVVYTDDYGEIMKADFPNGHGRANPTGF
jgi:hypothetical protein